MLFFIGGIQPKTVNIEDNSRMCPSCGLYQARLIRVDHYISLFFIPLLRVRKGEPFIRCDRCGSISGQGGAPFREGFRTLRLCDSCGREVPGDYRFCPYCGERL